jgi:hypothetical protein
LELFLDTSGHRYSRKSPAAMGHRARHDLENAVTNKLQVLTHGLLCGMGLALGNGADKTAMLLGDQPLPLAGARALAQKQPSLVLPDTVDDVEDRQQQAVARNLGNRPVQSAVPELATVRISAGSGLVSKAQQTLDIPVRSAQRRESRQGRLDLQAHIHNLEGIGAHGEFFEARVRLNWTRPEEGPFSLMAPDPPLSYQNFESPPQGLSADANLCGQDTLRREPLPLFE